MIKIEKPTYRYKLPFVFRGNKIDNSARIIQEFFEHWDLAVSVFKRGDMDYFWTEHVLGDKEELNKKDIKFQEIRKEMWNLENVGLYNEDVLFQKIYYMLEPAINKIPMAVSEELQLQDIEEIGERIVRYSIGEEFWESYLTGTEDTWNQPYDEGYETVSYVCQMLEQGIFSLYDEKMKEIETVFYELISQCRKNGLSRQNLFLLENMYYKCIMNFNREKVFVYGGKFYQTIRELVKDIVHEIDFKQVSYIGEKDDKQIDQDCQKLDSVIEKFFENGKNEWKNWVRNQKIPGLYELAETIEMLYFEIKDKKLHPFSEPEKYPKLSKQYIANGKQEEKQNILVDFENEIKKFNEWIDSYSGMRVWITKKRLYQTFADLLLQVVLDMNEKSSIENAMQEYDHICRKKLDLWEEWERDISEVYKKYQSFYGALKEHSVYNLLQEEFPKPVMEELEISNFTAMVLCSVPPIQGTCADDCRRFADFLIRESGNEKGFEVKEIIKDIHKHIVTKLFEQNADEEIECYLEMFLNLSNSLDVNIRKILYDFYDYLGCPEYKGWENETIFNFSVEKKLLKTKEVTEINFPDDEDIIDKIQRESVYETWSKQIKDLKEAMEQEAETERAYIQLEKALREAIVYFKVEKPYLKNLRQTICDARSLKFDSYCGLGEKYRKWESLYEESCILKKQIEEKIQEAVEEKENIIAIEQQREKDLLAQQEREKEKERKRQEEERKKKEKELAKAKARKEKIIKSVMICLLGAISLVVIIFLGLLGKKYLFSNVYYGTGKLYFGNNRYEHYEVAENVRMIPKGLFKNNKTMKSIMLPDSLEKIEKDAFNNCISLSQIKFPDNLESIGEGAFENCYELSQIQWNNGLLEIGSRAFASVNLSSLTGMKNYVGSTDAFYNCKNLELTEEEAKIYDINSLYEVAVPNSTLLENENQVYYAIIGNPVNENLVIEHGKGEIQNIQFESGKTDNSDISLDYVLDGYRYEIEGSIRREDENVSLASAIVCELNTVRVSFEKEFLLEQDENGNYYNVLPMIKEQRIQYQNQEIDLWSHEIVEVKVLDIQEKEKDMELLVSVEVKTPFTVIHMKGNLLLTAEIGEPKATLSVLEQSDDGVNLFGKYGDVVIEQKRDHFYYASNGKIFDVNPKYGSGILWTEYNEYSAFGDELYIDYNTGTLTMRYNRDYKETLQKTGEVEPIEENGQFGGIWKGNMMGGVPYTAYVFDMKDGSGLAIMDWAYISKYGSERSGIYLSQWNLDSSGKIVMNHGGFYHVTDGFHERWFSGTFSDDGNSIVTDLGTFVRQ